MNKFAKLIHQDDNVVTVVADCKAGEEVIVKFQDDELTYRCNQDVPYGHKLARVEIRKGNPGIKYGETIGSALEDISRGDWVHIHNVRDDYKCLDKDGNPLPGQENDV